MKHLITKIIAVAGATIALALFWPEKTAYNQIRHDSLRVEHKANYVDSFLLSYDSTQQLLKEVKRKRRHKTISVKTKVIRLIKHDTVAVYRTKYRPLPAMVDKDTYYRLQRLYADSLAQARQDSIDWAHRGIFKKIFGPKKQKDETK